MLSAVGIPVNKGNANEGPSHFYGIDNDSRLQGSVGPGKARPNGAEQLRGVEGDGVDAIQLLEGGDQNGSRQLGRVLLGEQQASLVLDLLGG